jgi:hypothetical protein
MPHLPHKVTNPEKKGSLKREKEKENKKKRKKGEK